MNLPQRKSPRRPDYDYTSIGTYFVTICTKNRQHYFGKICRDALVGCPNTEMIDINNENGQATSLSLQIHHDDYVGPSLGSIIGIFKSNVTKHIKQSGVEIPYGDTFARQNRYHDHIIRNEKEYNQIKYYIQTNLQNREDDTLNK